MSELPRLRGSERYGACDDEKLLHSVHAATMNSENEDRRTG